MLSLFVMYSNDRREALSATTACLQDMEGYDEAQKILVSDGPTEDVPPGWEHRVVERRDGVFCWSAMWAAGVNASRHEGIVYLDSDRLLPPGFLCDVASGLDDDVFLFTSLHFQMLREVPVDVCRAALASNDVLRMVAHPGLQSALRYEKRRLEPLHAPGKNVMSGSVAFTKSTFHRLGGVDPWYCGHGAYADSDFHLQAAVENCRFLDLRLPELHWPHLKLDQVGQAMKDRELHRAALRNFTYYCVKWDVPLTVAELHGINGGILDAQEEVRRLVDEFGPLGFGRGYSLGSFN